LANILGTTGDDSLIGTPLDDTLDSLGGTDYLSGGDGSDIYVLRQGSGGSTVTIEDLGTDGAVDTITGGRGLYASASLGYQSWATAERIGDDLIITLPGKPHRFRDPGYGPLNIEIADHFADEEVEYLEVGGITYRLVAGTIGGDENDIVGGTRFRDVIETLDGNDFVDAGAGNDKILTGQGDDIVFGGDGRDIIKAGVGNDRVFGGAGNDVIKSGAGNDWIDAGDGNNKVIAGAGNDYVFSGVGDDTIKGGSGYDNITGFDGDDLLIGGAHGDTYRFGYDRAALGTTDHWGHDVVTDLGSRARYDSVAGRFSNDTLEFYGLYGPSSGNMQDAIAAIQTERVGDNMVISTMDGLSSVTVTDQFLTGTHRYFIEEIVFSAGYWEDPLFRVVSAEHTNIGDDRGGAALYNEFLFGTAGADQIFSDSGYNLIWTGAGGDTLIYKESDPIPFSRASANVVSDTVMDFDVTLDRFDFSEIPSLTFADLTIGEDSESDAIISWSSGDVAVANIHIELRGVAMADVTEDLFVFEGNAPAPNPAPAPGDPITGTADADELVGTDFADRFVFTTDTAFSAIDTVKDYIVEHGDILDIVDLVIGFDAAVHSVADFAMLIQNRESDDVTLAVDRDGAGESYDATNIAVIIDGTGGLDAQTLFDSGLLLM
jgi:Ca2+-binding RTX toxin-like protein